MEAVVVVRGWWRWICGVLLLESMDRQGLLNLLMLFPLFPLLLALNCPTPLYPFHLLTTPEVTRTTRNHKRLTVSTESVMIRPSEEALTCHKRSQAPPVLAPISRRICHLYSDRRAHTDGRSVAPGRSLADTHQDPTHVFGGGKGFLDFLISVRRQKINYDNESYQLNYHPYSNYWPCWWRCWISLLVAHQ